MSRDFNLSWSTPSEGGNCDSPSWEEVAAKLNRIRGSVGDVELGISKAPSLGPQSLQIIADGCCYIVMLSEDTKEGSHVRTFHDPGRTGWIDIGGQNFGADAVIEDFEPVIRVFKEFYETGDVSKELLV